MSNDPRVFAGSRFTHARHLAPEGTRANPVHEECVITSVKRGCVYYTSAYLFDRGSRNALWYAVEARFLNEVGSWPVSPPGTDDADYPYVQALRDRLMILACTGCGGEADPQTLVVGHLPDCDPDSDGKVLIAGVLYDQADGYEAE